MKYSPELYRFVMKNAALIEDAWHVLEDKDGKQYVPELDAFVSKNRRLIEDAYGVLADLDEKLLLAISEYVGSYIEKERIDDVYFYKKNGAIVFGKNKWQVTKGDPEFGFWLDVEGGNGYASWLSYLTGQVPDGRTGFYFWINYRKVLTYAKGRKFLQENLSKIKASVGNKFYLVEGNSSVGYPFSLDIQELIAGIPENDSAFFTNEHCFSGIKRALDAIVRRIQVFDALAGEALQLSGENGGSDSLVTC